MLKRRKLTQRDFTWIRWSARDIDRIAKDIIVTKRERYEVIKQVPVTERTFKNTIQAIESSDNDIVDKLQQIEFLKNVSPKDSVRYAAGKNQQRLSAALVDIEFDRELYEAVKTVKKKRPTLYGEDKKLFNDMMKGYARMGLDLPKAKLHRLKANIKKRTDLSIEFDKNLNEYDDNIVVSKNELDGLPASFIDGLKRVKSGKYKVSLDYPEIGPFLAHAHSAKRRKELARKGLKKGGKRNIRLLKKMLALRKESARLLGYKNHVAFRTEMRTVRSPENVERFIKGLMRKLQKAARAEFLMLQEYKRKDIGNPLAQLKYYDVAYYLQKSKKELFDVDANIVKEYFPFQKVKKGTLEIYSKLLGLKFRQLEGMPLWQRDAELFEVSDVKSGVLAYFMLDLYPRKNKYGHAAVFPLITGRREGSHYHAPVACMVANFPKPRRTNPSLMSHGDVETFFHEFGHIMHHILSTGRYASQSGFSVATDFVEAPSQMLENWVWHSESLKKLSCHYKTGKALPQRLVERMVRAKLHGEAYLSIRQLVLATFDYMLHSRNVPSMNELYADLVHKHMKFTLPKDQIFAAGFGHLAGGYDAGYYSYMWSRVYAQDMFSRFEKEGILNPKTGKRYRKWILEKGSSVDELTLVKNFLGRKSNNKAFLKSLGINS